MAAPTQIAYTRRMRDHSDWMHMCDAEDAWAGKVRDISGRAPVAIEQHISKPLARLLYTRPIDREPVPYHHPRVAPLFTCTDAQALKRADKLFPHVKDRDELQPYNAADKYKD